MAQEEKARGAETTAKIIEIDPDRTLATSSAAAALMGADKYKNVVESRGTAEQQPFETKKKLELISWSLKKAANISKTRRHRQNLCRHGQAGASWF